MKSGSRMCIASLAFTFGPAVAVWAQPCVPWTTPSGSAGQFTWSNGQSCQGASGDVALVRGGLEFLPNGASMQTSTAGAAGTVTSSRRYVYIARGCLGGASLTEFGVVTIPPQGGRFNAGGSITTMQLACCGNCLNMVMGSGGSIEITQPGEHYWAYHAPAFFDVYGGQGWASELLVDTSTYMSLTINPPLPGEPVGEGRVTVSGRGSTPHVQCGADLDDGTGSGTPDGGTDVNDLLYFLDHFELGDTFADIDNGSTQGHPGGGTDINDLLFFLSRFEAGC